MGWQFEEDRNKDYLLFLDLPYGPGFKSCWFKSGNVIPATGGVPAGVTASTAASTTTGKHNAPLSEKMQYRLCSHPKSVGLRDSFSWLVNPGTVLPFSTGLLKRVISGCLD